MKVSEWREEFRKAGLTPLAIQHALKLVPVLQPLIDDFIREQEVSALSLAEKKQAPWTAEAYFKAVVTSIALRGEVVRRANLM